MPTAARTITNRVIRLWSDGNGRVKAVMREIGTSSDRAFERVERRRHDASSSVDKFRMPVGTATKAAGGLAVAYVALRTASTGLDLAEEFRVLEQRVRDATNETGTFAATPRNVTVAWRPRRYWRPTCRCSNA